MLSKPVLQTVLDNHKRAYELFIWINNLFREKNPPLARMTDEMKHAANAAQWMKKNAKSFPRRLAPTDKTLEPMAHLFVSYLDSSFEIIETHPPAFDTSTMCECCYSGWFIGKSMRRRNLTKADREQAETLKILYLQALMKKIGQPALSTAKTAAFLKENKDIAREIATATWAAELIRRTAYKSQGGGNLALWKEMSPPDKRSIRQKGAHIPKKTVPMVPETFINAEKTIIERLSAS